MSTGTQTFTGSKSFVNAPTFSSMTAGSLLFAGAGGLVSEDINNLFWDDTNKRLGIGTNAPVASLHNAGSTLFESIPIANLAGGGAIGTAPTTVDIKTTFNINQTTTNQTLTLPTPTDTTAGRIIYINNIGTV